MHRNLLVLNVFILVLMMTPSVAPAAPVRILATTTSAGTAVLELQADELVTMTAIPFRLLINDASGKPLNGAKVSCDMTMPSMPMPDSRPEVVESDGGYGGVMIFTCAMGAWQIDCLAEKPDGSRQSMTFAIGKVRMK